MNWIVNTECTLLGFKHGCFKKFMSCVIWWNFIFFETIIHKIIIIYLGTNCIIIEISIILIWLIGILLWKCAMKLLDVLFEFICFWIFRIIIQSWIMKIWWRFLLVVYCIIKIWCFFLALKIIVFLFHRWNLLCVIALHWLFYWIQVSWCILWILWYLFYIWY